ncbi:MAG: methylated-DNA--[protein]-cysteine S-methyltransferase [Hyphomicrobiaceae bacterium]
MNDGPVHSDTQRYALIDTQLGTCGIAWSRAGFVRLQLPETTREATELRISARRVPERGPLPRPVEAAVSLLQRYFAAGTVDLGSIAVDLAGVPEFHAAIYAALRRVPCGETITYGELARAVGAPGAARGVGQAMARNPVPVVIPCHRVLAKGERLGGFSAPGGVATKQRLLALERATDCERLPLFAPRS